MRRSVLLVAVLACCLVGGSAGRAALDMRTPTAAIHGLELVVVETRNCVYCALFRHDVLPAFVRSPRAKSLALSFADVADVKNGLIVLAAPIDIVPTVLLTKSGHEVGRIAGYVGRENFFHLLGRLIAGAE